MAPVKRPALPLWAAVAIAAAVYAVRSLSRGGWAPDLPGDAIVLALLVGVLALAATRGAATQRRRDDLAGKMQPDRETEGQHRKHDEVGRRSESIDARRPGPARDRKPGPGDDA